MSIFYCPWHNNGQPKYTVISKEQIKQRLISHLKPTISEASFITAEPVKAYDENKFFTLIRKIDRKFKGNRLYFKLRPYLKAFKNRITKRVFYRRRDVLECYKDCDNVQFLKLMYKKILKRDPDIEGFINYLFFLESNYPREVIYFYMASSHEAQSCNIDTESLKYYKHFAMKFFLKRKFKKLLSPWVAVKNLFAMEDHIKRLAFTYNRSIEFEERFKSINLDYTNVLAEFKTCKVELSDTRKDLKRLEEELERCKQQITTLVKEHSYKKDEMQ